MNLKKAGVLLVLLAAVAAFFVADLGRYLDLQALKDAQGQLEALRQQHPAGLAAAYFALYVAATALSVPGATVITLAGGALFGLWWGVVIVSFASSLGATLAFLASRFVLRDAVQARFGQRLAEIERGIERDGAFYLLSLRLIPVVPFFLINLLMGLTRMRVGTFYGVSQLGMLPGTLVYVNAGTQLAAIGSLRDVLSPALLGSLVLLGVFPWLARWVMGLLRRRRVLAPWADRRPRRFDRNLIVIGAGAGGLVTAYIGATVKAKVTLIEAGAMGGDCLNTGCVPSKALIRSAKLAHQMRHAGRWGLQAVEPGVPWREVMARVRSVIRSIEPHDSVERYTGLGVEVLQGRAQLIDPWTVEVTLQAGGTQRLSARSIVIATGASPVVPDLPGLQEACVTSETLWDALAELDAPPRRVAVLGGGPIGCELSQALARLGAGVTLVEQAPRLLLKEDAEVSDHARAALAEDGVQVLCGHRALGVVQRGGERRLQLQGDGAPDELPFDLLLCAVGRQARLKGFGLEALGLADGRVLETDAALQTRFPHIFAVGDVTGRWQLTHAAAHQAWYAAVNALFGHLRRFRVDARVMPAAVFIDPEIARVGLNEQEATAQGVPFEVTRYGIDDLDRALADSEAHGFVKVLTVPGRDTLLGVTIVGSHAAELLAEYVLAMKHGLGLNRILGTVHAYPTWSEANKYAAGEWRRAHAPQGVLRWLERYHAWRRG
ncbi:FAD-dependent oxidoreductase [Hydrogenophaga sp. IBVHS2]|uniref:FAD-dependent oxidoreductase n=1 Tax=Hydrogenophaga sp. IBVHS2 TaxID=1985170 RepID=UPI001C4F48B3|nr:bifunctional TVP38/TMEM64 family protein/FAD-dependent oxidoreductase [Hydrogenophaga sp. IBVHS2]